MLIRVFKAKQSRLLGGALGTVLLIGLMVPKAAHAVAAALVQVTNTLTNPVISLVNHKAASQLVQLAASGGAVFASASTATPLAQYNTTTSNIESSPYVVPAGQSLVITDLDFDIYVSSANDEGILISNANVTPTVFTQYYERFDFNVSTIEVQHVHLNSGIVFPAGATVGVTVTGSGFVAAVLRGYLTPA